MRQLVDHHQGCFDVAQSVQRVGPVGQAQRSDTAPESKGTAKIVELRGGYTRNGLVSMAPGGLTDGIEQERLSNATRPIDHAEAPTALHEFLHGSPFQSSVEQPCRLYSTRVMILGRLYAVHPGARADAAGPRRSTSGERPPSSAMLARR